MIGRLVTQAINPGGPRGSLSVLFFHSVRHSVDPLAPHEPTAQRFDTILGWLQRQLTILPLDEAVRRLREGRLPPAAGAVTFDDGYRDNFEIAAPILQRRGVPATFFVASGFLDGGIMWNDVVIDALRSTRRDAISLPNLGVPALSLHDWSARAQAVTSILMAIKYLPQDQRDKAAAEVARACAVEPPKDLMMSSEQIRSLAAMGFGIGAHTHTHPILARLADTAAEEEIRLGREYLSALVDQPVNLFAYPNGRWLDDFDERHMGIVERAGFDAAFSTEPGVGRLASNCFALPRFTPWDRDPWRFQLRMLLNMSRK